MKGVKLTAQMAILSFQAVTACAEPGVAWLHTTDMLLSFRRFQNSKPVQAWLQTPDILFSFRCFRIKSQCRQGCCLCTDWQHNPKTMGLGVEGAP